MKPGAGDSLPGELTNVNGTLSFAADDGSSGRELWRSNGTEAGTVRVKDINPGDGSSFPASLTNVNGMVFFSADDGTSGRELWQSDRTEAGTTLVYDIKPGSGSSSPAELTNVAGSLFFRAKGEHIGTELWRLNTSAGGGGDLTLNMQDRPDPVAVGETLTYSVFVANNGPEDAAAVALEDVLPESAEFISARAGRGSCSQSDGVVRCQLGTLRSGDRTTVEIGVRPTQPGTIRNFVILVSATADPDQSNNQARARTTVLG